MLPAESPNRERRQAFVSLCSGEASAPAADETKGAIDRGTLALRVPGGEQGLIWTNGNCDLFAGSH